MAIVKLVCQGCGANLDAPDSSRMVTCGYCGCTNHIKATVLEEPPRPVKPIVMQTVVRVAPPVAASNAAAKGIRNAVIGSAVISMVGAGAFIALATGSSAEGERTANGGLALAAEGQPARNYRWESGRVFPRDVDGDGREDILGLIQVIGERSHMAIVAISGADYSVLWEVDIGDRSTMPDSPNLLFSDDPATLLYAMGAVVRAIDPATGRDRWVANLPDRSEAMMREGAELRVRTIDGGMHAITLADGKLSPATELGGTRLRSDEGYDLIPDHRNLDLGHEERFTDVRVETAFCPPELLEVTAEPVVGFGPIACTHPHGLAWVSRDKGTAVPFLLAYDPTSKAERWRVQLTPAGTLETIDGGFGQPRAEFIGEEAIVSFALSKDQGAATIRRIKLADGATLWESKLPRPMTENVDGMVVGSQALYINHGGALVILDAHSGAKLERLGGW